MPIDIKPGQIWKDRTGDEHVRVLEVDATHVRYEWAEGAVHPGLHGARYVENFRNGFELASQFTLAESASPDPLKIKPGDTVTLEHPDGSRIVDRKVNSVYAVKAGMRQEYLSGLYEMGFTLTDHKPAQEPFKLPTGLGSIVEVVHAGTGEVREQVLTAKGWDVFRVDGELSARGANTAYALDSWLGTVFLRITVLFDAGAGS